MGTNQAHTQLQCSSHTHPSSAARLSLYSLRVMHSVLGLLVCFYPSRGCSVPAVSPAAVASAATAAVASTATAAATAVAATAATAVASATAAATLVGAILGPVARLLALVALTRAAAAAAAATAAATTTVASAASAAAGVASLGVGAVTGPVAGAAALLARDAMRDVSVTRRGSGHNRMQASKDAR